MDNSVQKALEKLQNAEATAAAVKKSLGAAQPELAAKPQDAKLIKKVEGLQKALSAKNAAACEAKTAYDDAVKKAEEAAAEKAASGSSDEEAENGEKKVSVRIKHKSTGQFYFRCGLRVKRDFETYAIPESKLERLKADPYIVFDEAGR